MKQLVSNLEFDFQKIGGALMGSGAAFKEFGSSASLYWAGIVAFLIGCVITGIKKKQSN